MSDCRHDAPNREPHVGDVQTQWQQLDEPANEERLDRLMDCLYSFEGDTDISEIDHCLEELEQAGTESAYFDVEQSLKEFHERYAPAFEGSTQNLNKKKTVPGRRPLARIAIIAAVLCAFMVTAQASGFDILGAIARWTSEQFSFVKVGDEPDSLPDLQYSSLQAALDDSDVVERLAPSKFPDGTVLDNIMVKSNNNALAFSATYLLDEEPFYISIRKVDGAPYFESEINDPNIDIYISGGIEHHLMTDAKQRKATWYNGVWEGRITGNLSRDDMLLMIDSIY